MARKIVTIQTRRGNSSDFDESKMLAGEIATAEDTEQAYISFSDGTAEELALKRDIPNSENTPNIPTALPNPYSLTFSGAVVAEYDGSSAVSVRIPTGGGSGGGSSVVIPADEQLSEDTLLVIDPDAAPDKIPQWYNGTAVTGAGQTAVSGSAAGDYYINTATFDVYHATAPDTWAYVGNIKGNTGSTGIFFGAYDGSDGQPPEDAVLWIDPNEAASAELITTAGLADALTAINNRIQYYEDTEINANVTRVYRIGNVLVQAGLVQPQVKTKGTPVTTPVYFSSALGNYIFAPTVLTDASGNNPLAVASGIGGTTTEQFTAYANRSDAAGSVNVRWLAIGICE